MNFVIIYNDSTRFAVRMKDSYVDFTKWKRVTIRNTWVAVSQAHTTFNSESEFHLFS